MLLSLLLAAAPAAPMLSPFGVKSTGGATLSTPMQIVIMLTLMTLLPALIMSVTPFLRVVVVLHFLRQALGTQSTPSNQIIIGLSLFLALLVMQPVGMQMYKDGWQPMEEGRLTPAQAMDAGSQPLKQFLTKFVREADVRLFLDATHSPSPRNPQDVELRILIPAYILSELKAAFQIGAVLFLPFLVIDLLVASVTLSLGMVQLPPVMISAPFKLLLFVLVDGWSLVIGSLLKSLQV
ncbi:flagellar type III secretion system pore protein FliP [uncultured Paludibaculum sp.]|uniref:flagellar type III secretion system pore protein FliP n=1 Tax=uncultured Paludibaculum sp. TaxID=1765020 RepID=UPI002AAB7095|nr:flagellar type III secretion system pore protein FliP [uncultured Paludibaculum sp.]